MSFRDEFVRWLYASMADSSPVGRGALRRVLELALHQGHITPASVDDLSLLLLLAAHPTAPALQTALVEEVRRRTLHFQPRRLWRLFDDMRPPRVVDVLESIRPEPLLHGLAGEVLICSELWTNLSAFLGRLFLRDPAGEQDWASQLTRQAAGRYYHITPAPDFTCHLYRHVRNNLVPPGQARPSILPKGNPPEWWEKLKESGQQFTEQEFLDSCLKNLTEPEQELLYLQFYARLTVEQIACVLQADDPYCTVDQVALALEECWRFVL